MKGCIVGDLNRSATQSCTDMQPFNFMPETGITRTKLLTELQQSRHGKLAEYRDAIGQACAADPEFLAHIIAHDFINGQIKDTKIALPVITLASREFPDELVENSLAHLAMQPPRELAKALQFSIDIGAPARRQRALEQMIRDYLRQKEANVGKWSAMAARHRRPLKELYAQTHAKTSEWVSSILFGKSAQYPAGTVFHDIAHLHAMSPGEAAAAIQKWKLSPLVVSGAMAGSKAQNSAVVVQAGMESMSDTELVTRVKSLERAGVMKDEGLKAGFRAKIAKASKKTKSNATLKTTIAAEEVEDDGLRDMLRELQERQIASQKSAGRGLVGNWLVIADRSQSQEVAIKLGVHVSSALAKFVTGQVHLVFCNDGANPVEASGLTLEQLQVKAKYITASGSTSYGIGLAWAAEKKLDLDGVVIVGDGGENTRPVFAEAWEAWRNKSHVWTQSGFAKELPIYFFQTYCPPHYSSMAGGNPGNFEGFMAKLSGTPQLVKHDFTKGNIDYYSIPNIVGTMSASTFGVMDKIMACPLVRLSQVLPGAVFRLGQRQPEMVAR